MKPKLGEYSGFEEENNAKQVVHEEAIDRTDWLWLGWGRSGEGKQKTQNSFVHLRAPGKEMAPLEETKDV